MITKEHAGLSTSIDEKGGVPEAPWKVEELMAWTGMSRRYLLDLARQGILPARRVGRTWFFSPSKVADFFGVSH